MGRTSDGAGREIENIESAMQHVEDTVQQCDLRTEQMLRGIHVTTVTRLRESDLTPGAYQGITRGSFFAGRQQR